MMKRICIVLALASCIAIADSNRMAHERLKPENSPPTLEEVSRLGYALGYSPEKRQPLWVAYRLRREDVEGELVVREKCFRYDAEVSNSPWPYDYYDSGYEKGHMAPAGDMLYDRERMRESFLMSNMSPQLQYVNRGNWKKIENFARKAAEKYGEVFVITGPIFEGTEGSLPKQEKVIEAESGNIPVPVAFYKVLFIRKYEMMIAFKIDNVDFDYLDEQLREKAPCPTAKVEELTGFRFFPDVDADGSLGLRNKCDINKWGIPFF